VGNVPTQNFSMKTNNSAVLLLSGGFDSAVAAHIMWKRGISLIGLHASLEPLVNDTSIKKSIAVSKALSIPLTVLKIGTQLATLSENTHPSLYFVLQKRFFLRLAESIALQHNAQAIVTGDNLGQVSSQTLSNLIAISHNAILPIFRPLLCYEKEDIIDYAKKYGLFELTVGPEMCDVLGPRHPCTRSSIHSIEQQEQQVAMDVLIQGALHNA
jgi:tRNA uracil 4-sulfurtransferase